MPSKWREPLPRLYAIADASFGDPVEIAQALIRNCDRPIAAPSANRFQSLSPTTADAVEKELGLDRDKTNVNGGAIALGHPLGASGTRLVITVLNELRRKGLRYGLATACIGGGQGIAIIVEAFS